MKKIILISCLLISIISFGAGKDLPENIEKIFVQQFQLILVLKKEKIMIIIKIHI